MKKQIRILKGALPHLCIVMSGMLIVFFAIDRVNPHQAFLENEFHKWLLFILSVCTIIESILLSTYNRRIERLRLKKRKGATNGKAVAKGNRRA